VRAASLLSELSSDLERGKAIERDREKTDRGFIPCASVESIPSTAAAAPQASFPRADCGRGADEAASDDAISPSDSSSSLSAFTAGPSHKLGVGSPSPESASIVAGVVSSVAM
jgi:hypothetical protein